MRRLYEIDAQLEDFEARLAEHDGNLTPEIEVEWEALIGEREDKWVAYIAMIRQMEAEAATHKAEADRLSRASATRSTAAGWLKERLVVSMDNAGITEARTPIGKLRVLEASQAPLIVDVTPEELPPQYQRVRINADSAALRADMAAGDIQDGLCHLGTRTRYVRIY